MSETLWAELVAVQGVSEEIFSNHQEQFSNHQEQSQKIRGHLVFITAVLISRSDGNFCLFENLIF